MLKNELFELKSKPKYGENEEMNLISELSLVFLIYTKVDRLLHISNDK